MTVVKRAESLSGEGAGDPAAASSRPARELFVADGNGATNLQDVADRAGVAVQTIDLHLRQQTGSPERAGRCDDGWRQRAGRHDGPPWFTDAVAAAAPPGDAGRVRPRLERRPGPGVPDHAGPRSGRRERSRGRRSLAPGRGPPVRRPARGGGRTRDQARRSRWPDRPTKPPISSTASSAPSSTSSSPETAPGPTTAGSPGPPKPFTPNSARDRQMITCGCSESLGTRGGIW